MFKLTISQALFALATLAGCGRSTEAPRETQPTPPPKESPSKREANSEDYMVTFCRKNPSSDQCHRYYLAKRLAEYEEKQRNAPPPDTNRCSQVKSDPGCNEDSDDGKDKCAWTTDENRCVLKRKINR